MNANTMVALANALDKLAKPIKGKLTPGTHMVEETVTIRVSGEIKKGEDVPYTPTAEIPILATLAISIEKSGIVGDNISRMLTEAMQEAMRFDPEAAERSDSSEAIKSRLKDVEDAMVRVRKITGELPQKTKSGGTRCKVTIEEASFTPAEAA